MYQDMQTLMQMIEQHRARIETYRQQADARATRARVLHQHATQRLQATHAKLIDTDHLLNDLTDQTERMRRTLESTSWWIER